MTTTKDQDDFCGPPKIAFSGLDDGPLVKEVYSLSYVLPDADSDPAFISEQEERVLIVRWLLYEAKIQGVILSAEREESLKWARDMLLHPHEMMERRRSGLVS